MIGDMFRRARDVIISHFVTRRLGRLFVLLVVTGLLEDSASKHLLTKMARTDVVQLEDKDPAINYIKQEQYFVPVHCIVEPAQDRGLRHCPHLPHEQYTCWRVEATCVLPNRASSIRCFQVCLKLRRLALSVSCLGVAGQRPLIKVSW